MFSVRVFIAAAGALLIPNAAEAKAVRGLECTGKDADICVYFEAAEGEIQQAHDFLTGMQLEKPKDALEALSDAKRDFENLLKGEGEPMEDLENALRLETKAYEIVEENCEGKCTTVLIHIGKSEGWTIAAIRQLLTDDEKKQRIGDLEVQWFSGQRRTEEEQSEATNDFGGEVLEVLSETEETESENN